jgi:hypothetical protein
MAAKPEPTVYRNTSWYVCASKDWYAALRLAGLQAMATPSAPLTTDRPPGPVAVQPAKALATGEMTMASGKSTGMETIARQKPVTARWFSHCQTPQCTGECTGVSMGRGSHSSVVRYAADSQEE